MTDCYCCVNSLKKKIPLKKKAMGDKTREASELFIISSIFSFLYLKKSQSFCCQHKMTHRTNVHWLFSSFYQKKYLSFLFTFWGLLALELLENLERNLPEGTIEADLAEWALAWAIGSDIQLRTIILMEDIILRVGRGALEEMETASLS